MGKRKLSERLTDKQAEEMARLVNRGYDRLYTDDTESWVDYRYWVDCGDYAIENHKRIVMRIAEARGDGFTSDRETAALAIALYSCGYDRFLRSDDTETETGYAVVTEYADGTEKHRTYKHKGNALVAMKSRETEICNGSTEIRGVWFYEGNRCTDGLRPWFWPVATSDTEITDDEWIPEF